jgi:hypothetical protein
MPKEVLYITAGSYGKLNAVHSSAEYAAIAVNGGMFAQIVINGVQ